MCAAVAYGIRELDIDGLAGGVVEVVVKCINGVAKWRLNEDAGIDLKKEGVVTGAELCHDGGKILVRNEMDGFLLGYRHQRIGCRRGDEGLGAIEAGGDGLQCVVVTFQYVITGVGHAATDVLLDQSHLGPEEI